MLFRSQLNGVFNNTDPSLGAPGYNVILQLTQVPCLNGIQAAGGNFVPAACDDAPSVPIPNPLFGVITPEELAARTVVYFSQYLNFSATGFSSSKIFLSESPITKYTFLTEFTKFLKPVSSREAD